MCSCHQSGSAVLVCLVGQHLLVVVPVSAPVQGNVRLFQMKWRYNYSKERCVFQVCVYFYGVMMPNCGGIRDHLVKRLQCSIYSMTANCLTVEVWRNFDWHFARWMCRRPILVAKAVCWFMVYKSTCEDLYENVFVLLFSCFIIARSSQSVCHIPWRKRKLSWMGCWGRVC